MLNSVLCDDPASSSYVQFTIRPCVSTSHLFVLVNLGTMIEDTLLYTWNSYDLSSFSSTLEKDNKALWYVDD